MSVITITYRIYLHKLLSVCADILPWDVGVSCSALPQWDGTKDQARALVHRILHPCWRLCLSQELYSALHVWCPWKNDCSVFTRAFSVPSTGWHIFAGLKTVSAPQEANKPAGRHEWKVIHLFLKEQMYLLIFSFPVIFFSFFLSPCNLHYESTNMNT